MKRDVTLKEALGKFHRKNSRIISDTEILNDSELFYNCHDIAHVVFDGAQVDTQVTARPGRSMAQR